MVWLGYLGLLYFSVFWLLVFMDKGVKEEEKPLRQYPQVTIAIPAYNEEHNILSTIQSALDLEYPPEKVQIIVINDGSKDRTQEIAVQCKKLHSERNILILSQENKGKGAALNHALRKATGEIFIPFDADSLIRRDALQKMIPEFSQEDMGAVLPLMKVRNPQNLLEKIQWCEYLINLFYKRLMSSLDCVSVAPGPFSAYRASVIKKLGGFDESNLTEDLEISLKLQKHHYRLKQIFTTEVYTRVPSGLRAFFRQRNRWYKGTLLNAIRYRKMAFNRKYGDFGFIQMPRLMLESIAVAFLFCYVAYASMLKPLALKFYNLSLINYEIIIPFSNYYRNLEFIDLNLVNIFHSIAFGLVALLLIYYAHKHTREPLKKHGYITIPAYMIAYSILAALAILSVFFDLARGKVQKW